MTKITEKKKVHTKALHSLLMMKTVTLAMQAEHVTNITTPKGKLSSVLEFRVFSFPLILLRS